MVAAGGRRWPFPLQAKSEGSSRTAARHSPLADCICRHGGCRCPGSLLLLGSHLGMQTLPFPSPQAEPAWLPQLLPPGSLSLEQKGRRSAEVSSRCCSYSTAWLAQGGGLRAGPRARCCSRCLRLGQRAPGEDDHHGKSTRDQFGATLERGLWSQTDDAAPLYLSLAAPAAAAGSHQAPKRQGAEEGLGAETPQAERVGTLAGCGAGYSRAQTAALHQHVISKTLPLLLNTELTEATAGLHTKSRQL